MAIQRDQAVPEIDTSVRQATASDTLRAVLDGLSNEEKKLPSWLLYDSVGDALFQRIMALPEYYPTRCELEIIRRHRGALRQLLACDSTPFQVIELGAGDATKTQILLESLLAQPVRFEYVPIDISPNTLAKLAARLKRELPVLDVKPAALNYVESLHGLKSDLRKVVMLLGANIGNYSTEDAAGVLLHIRRIMNPKDLFFVGFDLKKEPRTIINAYDDAQGVTRAFNLNMLRRINRELNADFNLEKFAYYPSYNPASGNVESYLVSTERQRVFIRAADRYFEFLEWEPVLTEISKKYDLSTVSTLMERCGFEIITYFLDERSWFADVLARRKSKG